MKIFDLLVNEFGDRNFNVSKGVSDIEIDTIEEATVWGANYRIINLNSTDPVVVQIVNSDKCAGYRVKRYFPEFGTELPLSSWNDFWIKESSKH